MVTREQLYKKFGPKTIEALIRLLRKHVPAFQAFSAQQIMDALDEEIESIPDYEWMKEVIPKQEE